VIFLDAYERASVFFCSTRAALDNAFESRHAARVFALSRIVEGLARHIASAIQLLPRRRQLGQV
jgi:hypothetical protein